MTDKLNLEITDELKESLIHDFIVASIEECISNDKYNRVLNKVFKDIPLDMRHRIMDRLCTHKKTD